MPVYVVRSSKRPRGRLEDAFDDGVVVAPVERLDVQGYSRRLREGLEPVLEQFGIEIAEALLAELRLPHGERPPGNVQREPAQRLVHRRSEEHTSELKSLMRISYAVFCLKKTKNRKTTDIGIHNHDKSSNHHSTTN